MSQEKAAGAKLRMSIRLRKNRRGAVVTLGFLTIYVAGFGVILAQIWGGDPARSYDDRIVASLVNVVFFALWTPVLLLMWRTSVGGRDVVTIQNGSLALRREVLGLGFTRSYRLAYIQRLRFQPEIQYPESRVAFDYGSRTIGFGAGLGEDESRRLMAAIENGRASAALDQDARVVPAPMATFSAPAGAALPLELRLPPPRPVHLRGDKNFVGFFAAASFITLASLSLMLLVWNQNQEDLHHSQDATFGVLFMGSIFLLFWCALGDWLFKSWRLARFGATAVGRITDKRIGQGKMAHFKLGYTFLVSGNSWDSQAEQSVAPRYYDRVEIGDEAIILYDPARPERNIPYDSCVFKAGKRAG